MKSLFVIRHAKSSWDIAALNDFDRILNERGQKDAPMMAKRLLQKKIVIDAFISSNAVRAFSTAKLFAQEYGVIENTIITIPELYHASPFTFHKVVANIDNKYQSVAIFSHNPGITEFVNELTTAKIDNMPTCGIFALKININHWNDFGSSKKEFLFFDYPKSV